MLLLPFIVQMLINGVSMTPGDETEYCRHLRAQGAAPIPAYSATTRILMDSWNYRNLLPPHSGAVWDHVDNDDNNPSEITTNWIQNSNTPCQQSVHVCGFSAGPQDSWLITQLINRTVNGMRLPQVSVTIELELRDCDDTLMCLRTFNTHLYETSSVDATRAKDIKNYRQVERISPEDTSGAKINETIDISFITDHSSFYFAIQDKTTCMAITRMMVFYHICPAEIIDLVIHPETIAPPISRQSSLFQVTAKCVNNASPAMTEASGPKIKCTEEGVWFSIPELGCMCNHGFVPSVDRQRCEGCPNGQFYSNFTSTCLDCPENSASSNGDAPLACTCADGYYFRPRGSNHNESCVAIILKEKSTTTTSSLSTLLLLPVLLVIALIGTAITVIIVRASYMTYKRYKNTRNRVYQVTYNRHARRGNELGILLREEPAGTQNGVQQLPPRPPPRSRLRQISNMSTATTTSFKWNLAYFLFKIFGSSSDSDVAEDSPVAPGPQTQPGVTASLPAAQTSTNRNRYGRPRAISITGSREWQMERSHDSALYVNAAAVNGRLESPDYINYEVIAGQRDGDTSDKPTDFREDGYLHVLS